MYTAVWDRESRLEGSNVVACRAGTILSIQLQDYPETDWKGEGR